MSTATVTIEAFAAKDAALKFTPSGRPVLELDLPVTPKKKNERGEWEDAGETAWYRCSLWGPMAETVQIPKGTLVQVVGALTVRPWVGKGGKTGTALEVNVKSIGILREARGSSGRGGLPQSQHEGYIGTGASGYHQAPPDDPWAGQQGASQEPPW